MPMTLALRSNVRIEISSRSLLRNNSYGAKHFVSTDHRNNPAQFTTRFVRDNRAPYGTTAAQRAYQVATMLVVWHVRFSGRPRITRGDPTAYDVAGRVQDKDAASSNCAIDWQRVEREAPLASRDVSCSCASAAALT
jgi:hypothetical protein